MDPLAALRAHAEELQAFCEDAGWEYDLLSEEIYEAWPKVLSGLGGDPVHAAAAWARSQDLPALRGEWPPFLSTRRDAALTIKVCEYLSRNGSKTFFLPCRKLAAALNCDHDRAARILRLLVSNGHLQKQGNATKRTAQRYALGILTESTESTDITESIETTEANKVSLHAHALHETSNCTIRDRQGSNGASAGVLP
jgi:hypothetical protein